MSKIKKLPDSELEIMLIIWERTGQTTTSDIMQRLGDKKSVQLVQVYLGRLEEKGFVCCEKLGRLNHYTPLISMEHYRKQETESFVEKFYYNSPTKLFAALLQSNSIQPEDLADIKRMLEKEGD